MSLATVHARIAEIQRMFPLPSAPPVAAPAPSASPSAFQAALQGATGTSAAGGALPVALGGATSAGQAIVALAQAEVGVAEQPPGSNDAPRIAQYRQATAGSGVGPWCAYFTSWLAREAGVPVGESGQGFGAVEQVWAWGQRAGKAIPAGSGVAPQPGDLIVWGGRHIGIVEAVDADGSIRTIEGNSSDAVSRRTYGPDGGGATGYVRLG